jgi:UDP-glucose 4-epimerase
MKSKQNVLVTGGAGFIGSSLSSRLVDEGFRVFVVDNLSTGFESNIHPQAEFLEIDISKEWFVDKLPKTEYSCIFHLAAQSSGEISFENPEYDVKTNVMGTFSLLKWAKDKNLKRFVYASSMSIYGDVQDLPVKEICQQRPNSFYGVGKLASEKYGEIYKKIGLPVTTLRLFNVYGPGQNMKNLKQGMVSIYMAYIAKNEPIIVKGSRDRFRDFIYIDDVVDAFVKTAFSTRAVNQVFNVGTGQQTFVWQLLEYITDAFGYPEGMYPIKFEGCTPGDQVGIYADISKIWESLSWRPKVDLSHGIKKMAEWLKSEEIT